MLKDSELGLTVRISVAAIPVPESGTVVVAGEAVLVTVTEPVTALAAVGVKATVKLVLCPADKVSGRLGADTMANCEGVALKLVRERELVPVLVKVRVCSELATPVV